MNRSKDSFWVNVNLVDIVAESTLNISHDFKPSTLTAAHIDVLPPPTRHIEPKANAPTPDINIVTKTPKGFRYRG